MEFKELKNKKEVELHKILSENREKLRDLRFKDASKQLKNVREIRIIRKTIARVLMLLNTKQKIHAGAGRADNGLPEQTGKQTTEK